MDFNTYLKKNHGYTQGDKISKEKIRSLRIQFENSGNVEAAMNASANAIKTAMDLNIENAIKAGTPIDTRIIDSASKLFKTGQPEKAQSLINDATRDTAETRRQQLEAQQTELENNNIKLEEEKLIKDQMLEDQNKKIIIEQAKFKLEKIKSVQSQDISDVVGAFEPVARYGRAVAAEMGANWAKENQKLIKDLNFIATDDILEKARKLAPVTETDLSFLQKRVAPQETDNDTIWFDFLKQEAKNLELVIGEFEKTESTKTEAPLTDTQQLRTKIK